MRVTVYFTDRHETIGIGGDRICHHVDKVEPNPKRRGK
jgi:hypothetical protein